MTQTNDVLYFLFNKPDKISTSKEIAQLTGIKIGNIYKITGNLTKKGILKRLSRGVYRAEEYIYRHYISALFYCSGRLKPLSAESYKQDNEDIFEFLVNVLLLSATDKCGSQPMIRKGRKADPENSRDFGYSIDLIPIEDRNASAIYPDFFIPKVK